jgi:hypothetical protein
MLVRIADTYTCHKKTYNNAISALRRAFNFGYLDYPERADPAASLKYARIGKKDRPAIDPVTDYDATHGVLGITKARVNGLDVTKTGEDRGIVLCPRAIAVIERQLRLRERLLHSGLVDARPPVLH